MDARINYKPATAKKIVTRGYAGDASSFYIAT
jgi:hypothetical protein